MNSIMDKIIAFESGEQMHMNDVIELFSELIKNGMAYTLQGHYGRTADSLIRSGYLNRDGDILKTY